ncbi:hypothetical protein HZS_1017 [Henneguya salminicola]|nr:hypothetical protein HZS_1017 [Henneguya salminicola]
MPNLKTALNIFVHILISLILKAASQDIDGHINRMRVSYVTIPMINLSFYYSNCESFFEAGSSRTTLDKTKYIISFFF